MGLADLPDLPGLPDMRNGTGLPGLPGLRDLPDLPCLPWPKLPTLPRQVRTPPVRNEVRTETTARGCKSCRHRKRPGLSAGYCGGGRDDLPGAYGLHHPLRKLPDDQGEGCASYLPHEG